MYVLFKFNYLTKFNHKTTKQKLNISKEMHSFYHQLMQI